MKKLSSLLAFTFVVSGAAFAAPVNKTCPVGSRPVRTDITVTYQGKEVALCCSKCKAKFEAEPAKYAANIK